MSEHHPHKYEREEQALLKYLTPIIHYFEDDCVQEIQLMADGSVIVEDFKNGMHVVTERIEEKTKELIARTISHISDQNIFYSSLSVPGTVPKYNARVQIITPPVTLGIRINFRLPGKKIISLMDMLSAGLLDEDTYNFLINALENEKNIVISGATGSGKTTFLNALLDSIEDDCNRHLYIIEDRPEIRCSNKNATFIQTHFKYTHQMALFDALRMNPTSIFFGEIRDKAALDLLKAWNTGHKGGMATVHANSATETIERLKQMYEETGAICDRAVIYNAVDLILFVEKQRENGKTRFVIKEGIELSTSPKGDLKIKIIFSQKKLGKKE